MRSLWMACLVLFALTSGPARALDAFEYQVYDAEINKPAEFSLETHLNSNLVGHKDPQYEGQLAVDHLTHVTFEFARGMTPVWELGSYLQTAYDRDGNLHYAGVKLRSKFVLPRRQESPWQLGLNLEISNVPLPFEDSRWGFELRPIFGYTLERWTLLCNPIVGAALATGQALAPDFSPALKLAFDTHLGFAVAVEYYSDLGEFKALERLDHAQQYGFLAFDLLDGPLELNLALGGGFTEASNATVAKAIVGTAF